MFKIPYTLKVGYNRHSDPNKDFFKEINIMAVSIESAIQIAESYGQDDIFDNLEEDYVEDSLYVVK